jgi:hypothetical protein
MISSKLGPIVRSQTTGHLVAHGVVKKWRILDTTNRVAHIAEKTSAITNYPGTNPTDSTLTMENIGHFPMIMGISS